MDQWEEGLCKVECQVVEGIPSYLMKKWGTRCSWVLHWNQLFLIAPIEGTHLCTAAQAKWARCTTTTLEEQIQKSDTEYELSIASPALDRWDSSRVGK